MYRSRPCLDLVQTVSTPLPAVAKSLSLFHFTTLKGGWHALLVLASAALVDRIAHLLLGLHLRCHGSDISRGDSPCRRHRCATTTGGTDARAHSLGLPY